MSGWWAALRIARREALRAKGRSALVIAMVALPVLGLSFAAVSYDMFHLTPAERASRQWGSADAQVRWDTDKPIEQEPDGRLRRQVRDAEGVDHTSADVVAALPTGSRVLMEATSYGSVSHGDKTIEMAIRGIDVADPLAKGLVTLTGGRAPRGDSEAALSESAARRLGVRIGDRFTVAANSPQDLLLVGIVEFPSGLDSITVVVPADRARNLTDPVAGRSALHFSWLVDTPAPMDRNGIRALNAKGMTFVSRSDLFNPAGEKSATRNVAEAALGWTGSDIVVGGVALLEMVLLAGPAFAVGARRRERELALIAANGGSPAQLRRVVLADGVVLGFAGGLVGVAVAILVAFAARPLVETYVVHARAGGYRILPLALVVIAALAITVGVLASLTPAVIAARQDTASVLTGRRAVVSTRRRWLVLGLSVTTIGAAACAAGAWRGSADLARFGLVTGEFGLVLCTPAMVGLIARFGGMLPLAPRMALRKAARNRSASAPAICAVMAAVAGSVLVGTYVASQHARQESLYRSFVRPGSVLVWGHNLPSAIDAPVTEIERLLNGAVPVRRTTPVRLPNCGVTPYQDCSLRPVLPIERRCPYTVEPRDPRTVRAAIHDPRCAASEHILPAYNVVLVDDGAALPILTGLDDARLAHAVATLRAGGVVVPNSRYVVNGAVTLVTTEAGEPRPIAEATVPGYAIPNVDLGGTTVVSTSAVQRLGLTAHLGGMVAETRRMPTKAEEDRLSTAVRKITASGVPPYTYGARVERGLPADDLYGLLLMLAAGLITLGSAFAATGLAAVEDRPDLATLAAVGASPRTRRTLSMSSAGIIAGLGSLLGAIAGLGSAVAIILTLNQRYANSWPHPEPYPLTVPWLHLAVVVVLVPVLAMACVGLVTRSRLPIERRA
jgi:putative ABC transport system permease protein